MATRLFKLQRLASALFILFFLVHCKSLFEPDIEYGDLVVSISQKSLKGQLTTISFTLKNQDSTNIIRTFRPVGPTETFAIDSVETGEWTLLTEAQDEFNNNYVDSTSIKIEKNVSNRADLVLGFLIFYDFNDGQPPPWGGNADMSVEQDMLRITSTRSVNWRFDIFDPVEIGRYTEGKFEFKVNFGAEGYYFDFRGHSQNDRNEINWGPFVDFREGVVYASTDDFIDTGGRYTPDTWYKVRAELDNFAGNRGRFTLFMKNLTNDESETMIGEFDYFASNGRLADIVQFSFGVRTLDLAPQTSMLLDDVKLIVR